jgi:replicative DNA helicase
MNLSTNLSPQGPYLTEETGTLDVDQYLLLERSLLSSAIIDPDALAEIDDLKIQPSDFLDQKYQTVFSHIQLLRDSGKPIDLVTIVDSLKSNNDIYKIGGASFVANIFSELASSANIRFYAQRVKEQSLSRQVFQKAKELAQISKQNLSREDLIEKVNQTLISLNDEHETGTSLEMKESVLSVIKSLRDKDSLQSTLTKTGFSTLDDKIVGITPGQLIVLAARPAMGKTSLALNIGKNVAHNYNEHVLIFSLEMMNKELTERFIAIESQVNSKKFNSRDFTSDELVKIAKASEKCASLKILIDDYSGSTIHRIRNQALRHRAKYGKLRLLIIDYLQLIPYQESRKGNKADDIGTITRSLKLLSKEVNCPVICISQLNRGVEVRDNKRPTLADLRDSGAIEQDADMVWFIYRDEVYNPDTKSQSEAEVIISKNRGGETGTAKLRWIGEYTKFNDL